MPRLVGMLAPGGWLAVQMPRQFDLPSHRFLRDIAGHMFPRPLRFPRLAAPVWPAAHYWDMLAPLGRVTAWETDYVQHLPAVRGRAPGAGVHVIHGDAAHCREAVGQRDGDLS